MVNYPYPADLIGPVPGHPVQVVCDYFENLSTDSSPTDIFEAMLEGALVFFDYNHTETCYDIHEEQPVEEGALSANGWYFLECSDMIMPIGSNGITDMFPERLWSNEEWAAECEANLGYTPRDEWALDYFGGKNLYELASFTNIFYSNGKLDPWSAGGLKTTITDKLPSFFITGGAHHLDLRAPNPADPPEVVYARELETYYARKWINEKLEVQGPEEMPPIMKKVQM
jgi:lysosomal Pro-X carboxypeptidase